MSAPEFLPATELCRAFYDQAVRPLLGGRRHGAGLLGWGSDVLGYDTQRSTDHGWGPRLQVFVDDPAASAQVVAALEAGLPADFHGWPVRFGWDEVAVTQQVTVSTVAQWSLVQLGVDATAGMSTLDWLLTPQQRLLGVVSGAVYADDTGALARLRAALRWYPDQVWRWLIGCQWSRIAEEEAFVARTAEVGDEAGSAVTAARLVRDLMRLALLLDRRYWPYQKWLGTAFSRAGHADDLPARLTEALHAPDVGRREEALAAAYSALATRHNAAGITEPLATTTGDYYSRPARVLRADRFAAASLATVTDPELHGLPVLGSVDQVVDHTDLLTTPELFRRLASLYRVGRAGASG